MGDEGTGKNKRKSKVKNEKTTRDVELKIAKHVSPAIRSFIHLGCEYSTYRAQNYYARGISSVGRLGFNYRKAFFLGIFSEDMTETFLQKRAENEAVPVKEYEKVPKEGWPNANVVQIAQNLLMGDGGACRPAAIFVLAACCRTPGPACPAAYSSLKTINNAHDLFLFVKYAMDLSPKRKGWGSGFRRALKSWYLDQFEPKELAEQITRYKQRNCWAHRDVLRLIHAKPKNKVQGIVIAYAFGLEKAQEQLNSIPKDDPKRKEAEDIMAYLEDADALRKLQIPKGADVDCTQVKDAVKLIKKRSFYLEHCDDTMHLAPAVWEALLERMPSWQILMNLPNLKLSRIIKPGDDINKVLLACLKRTHDALTKHSSETIHPPLSPALVLISMQTYRRKYSDVIPSKLWIPTKDGVIAGTNPTSLRHGASEQIGGNPVNQMNDHILPESEQNTEADLSVPVSGLAPLPLDRRIPSRLPKELPKPNQKVLENLSKILVASIKSLCPTRKRFIFGAGNIQEKTRCLGNPYVMTNEAAALIFMCLEKAEAEGTVSGYSIPAEEIPCRWLRCTGYSIINCAREITTGMGTDPIKVDGWINWLCKEKIRGDMLVLMADIIMCEEGSGDKLLDAMKNYRKQLKLPHAKLVIVSLSSENVPSSDALKGDDGILMVIGFDSHLPFIIQRFARNEF